MIDVSREEFDELVADALDRLPPELARLMDNVAIFVEEDTPDGEDLLGLYEGIPLTERESATPSAIAGPDHGLPAARARGMRGRDDVRREVEITVVHEVAHHFGIDDQRLHELGYD